MWPYPRTLAHRGGGTLAPENTLAALRCGLAYGYRAVEFDVMLASDGVPVVVHDPELGRTVAGSGHVNDYTAAQLGAMEAGAWFGAAFAGEGVPTFDAVVAYCKAQRIWMNIEIKPAPGFDVPTGAAVARATRDYFAQGNRGWRITAAAIVVQHRRPAGGAPSGAGTGARLAGRSHSR